MSKFSNTTHKFTHAHELSWAAGVLETSAVIRIYATADIANRATVKANVDKATAQRLIAVLPDTANRMRSDNPDKYVWYIPASSQRSVLLRLYPHFNTDSFKTKARAVITFRSTQVVKRQQEAMRLHGKLSMDTIR